MPTTTTTTTTTTQTSTTTTTRNKWVINLSCNPLIKAQETLLARGPNFAIVPQCSHKEAYIIAVEGACIKFSPKNADGLRAKSSQVLKWNCPLSVPSISWEEIKTIRELKENVARVIPTGDKGVAIVVMDRVTQTQHSSCEQTATLTSQFTRTPPISLKIDWHKLLWTTNHRDG